MAEHLTGMYKVLESIPGGDQKIKFKKKSRNKEK